MEPAPESIEPASEGRFERALLERHKPLYRLDSQEAYGLLSAASMTDNPGNSLIREDGFEIATAAGRGPKLSLATLERYPGGGPRDTDQLTHAAGRFRDAVEMALGKRGGSFPDRVYGRVIDDEGMTWLQHWSWHYHNPKRILGIGEHEGDWELVQIGLEGDAPVRVTFAQHDGGETRSWENVVRRGVRPVVWVAPFSHAAYFEPGTQAYALRFLADNPDGAGPEVDPTLLRFDGWVDWPGKWGRSSSLARKLRKLGGVGPRSPARQRRRWYQPAAFNAGARARRDRRARLGWTLGRLTYPRDPRALEVLELQGGWVRVRYTLPWFRSGSRLLLTAHDPGLEGTPLVGGQWVDSPGHQRVTAVELIASLRGEAVVVRVSAFNTFDQRSNCNEIRATLRAGQVVRQDGPWTCRR